MEKLAYYFDWIGNYMTPQTMDLTLKPKCPVCGVDNITREIAERKAPWYCQGCGFACHDVEAFLNLVGKETDAKSENPKAYIHG